MNNHLTRRNFVGVAATATLAGTIAPIAAAVEGGEGKSLKILGVACSPRRGMIHVGGRPPAFLGGTLLATKDDISGDELGLSTARNTGLRVADFALKLAI